METLGVKALVAGAAALVAGASYVDAHYGISRDVGHLLADRKFGHRIAKRIRDVGDVAGVYGHVRTADPTAEALWFEGRSWTYAQVLKGRYRES